MSIFGLRRNPDLVIHRDLDGAGCMLLVSALMQRGLVVGVGDGVLGHQRHVRVEPEDVAMLRGPEDALGVLGQAWAQPQASAKKGGFAGVVSKLLLQ